MRRHILWGLSLFGVLVLPAWGGEPLYRCTVNGNVQYTNKPDDPAKCKPVDLRPEISIPAPTPRSPSLQKPVKPEEACRANLEAELASAQQELDAAKKALSDQDAVRYGNERNYQRKLNRLQPYKDAVAEKEQKVKAIDDKLNDSNTCAPVAPAKTDSESVLK